MASGEQTDQSVVDHSILSPDNPADVFLHARESAADGFW
jgi:hypothetical protein